MADDPSDGHPSVEALEEEIFQAMAESYRADDFDEAERYYRVWIKLPTKRAWPTAAG